MSILTNWLADGTGAPLCNCPIKNHWRFLCIENPINGWNWSNLNYSTSRYGYTVRYSPALWHQRVASELVRPDRESYGMDRHSGLVLWTRCVLKTTKWYSDCSNFVARTQWQCSPYARVCLFCGFFFGQTITSNLISRRVFRISRWNTVSIFAVILPHGELDFSLRKLSKWKHCVHHNLIV